MVPIEDRTTVHGIDWAQTTGHGLIVHENPVLKKTNETAKLLLKTNGKLMVLYSSS